MNTAIFDSDGYEYMEGVPETKRSEPPVTEIEEAFFAGLECYIGDIMFCPEVICFFRARPQPGQRLEQFYGYFRGEENQTHFDNVLPAFKDHIEQEWGGEIEPNYGNGALYKLSKCETRPPTELPGPSSIHEQIRHACLEDLQTVIEVPDAKIGITLAKSFYKADGRKFAIGDKYRPELFDNMHAVFLITDNDKIELLSGTRD